ncbi:MULTISPECIES: CHAT domain-containing protein [Actinosynnema]|uniref:CHAT domain-containing protein n=1 Tax=Actinosynnema TaxID=40566 RepID=UPI0020A2A860|nr:CHAT domain-containing protein [Actinosynnema pretiosum]MCP2093857.1 CHAT domain-containing protein [Actinosynnema pretiosum]
MRQGLALLETPGIDPQERLEVRVRLLVTLAFCLAETTSFDTGLAQLDEVDRELPGLLDDDLRDTLASNSNMNRAALLCRVGRIDEGVARLDVEVGRSEARYRARPSAETADQLIVALSNRGNALGEAQRHDRAAADLDRVVELADAHDMPMRAAIAKHALGNALQRIGDVPAALREYHEANRAFQELEPGLLLRLRIDQAEALISVGLADEAGRLLDEVLPEMRRQRIGQDVAEAELFRAAAALQVGDLALAKRLGAAAQRKLVLRGSPVWGCVAGLLVLRVEVRRALESPRRPPERLVERAMGLSAELAALALPEQAAFALALAARLEIRRGEPDRAERLLRGVPKSRRLVAIDLRMLLRLCRAELALVRGNRRVALAQARAGLDELGRMRDRLGGLEMLSGAAVHGLELGELAVRLALGDAESAQGASRLFTWLERTKAQLFRYDPVETPEDDGLTERVTEVRRLTSALLRARLDGQATGELEERLRLAKHDATRLGWGAAPWGTPRPVVTAAEVAAVLGDRALVSFAVSDDELVAAVLVDDVVRLVRLGPAGEATESARRLHADLNALAPDHLPAPLVEVISASARREAEKLDRTLLRPLAAMLGGRELVVVPTGALHAVPWGVLPTCAGRPTSVVPSATAWVSALGSGQDDPDGVLLVRGPGLQAAQTELDRLAGYHDRPTVLDVPQSKVGAVLSALAGQGLAHIAAHGEHEPENALFSRLELADGAVFAYEIGRVRHLPAKVVLSACELALNRVRPGDEPLGFAGALLAGGVRTVIAASSKVGDQPSAAAMEAFHRGLLAGETPAVALAQAVAEDPLRRPFVCLGAG